MLRFTFLCIFTGIAFHAFSQAKLSGTITDQNSGEALFGANVIVSEGVGTTADFDGKFSIELQSGTYNVKVSYIGYKTKEKQLTINENNVFLNVNLEIEVLDDVIITSDIAIDRETPVAFTNIPAKKLQEELANQDIPMVLNSTPGVYATQQGGGDGDARINIRGFNQSNVAVMIDGIPVNDMENGWVYWSNWFGLDQITRTIQVQRGLGASKLAIPSVGGTINIITKSVDSKPGLSIRQDYGTGDYLRTSLGFNSGKVWKGVGVTGAASYKQGNGWVEGNFTKGFFYYLKLEKMFKDVHKISITGFGAPQEHGQRPFTAPIERYSRDKAIEVGMDTADIIEKERGLQYNEFWGYETNEDGSQTVRNERKNYYHKPQFSARHSYFAPTGRFYLVSNAYLSLGRGGGTGPDGASFLTDSLGRTDWDAMRNFHAIKAMSTSSEKDAATFLLRSSVNNHNWYGLLSTFGYQINEQFDFSGGVDLRSYTGQHYREVYDLIGAKYHKPATDERDPFRAADDLEYKVGEKYLYNYDGLVRWGGVFGLLEYSKNKLSVFANLSGSYNGYNAVDYFAKKHLVLEDDTVYLNALYAGDTITRNGNQYTANSDQAEWNKAGWEWIPGGTVKIGANYNINSRQNVFMNAGYLSKAPRFSNVILRNPLRIAPDYRNELVQAFELGYSYRSRVFSFNTNLYYTKWLNKPFDDLPLIQNPEDENNPFEIRIYDIDALHMGLEFDFAYQIMDNLKLQGLMSIADWTWNSEETGEVFDQDDNYIRDITFDATGIHVGDAAQTQLVGNIRYEPIKGLYIKPEIQFFSRNFADFNPESVVGENGGRDSWQMPDYYVLNLSAGYTHYFGKYAISLRGNLFNLLDDEIITDARNNDTFVSPSTADFDAKSATVHFAQGIRFNTSLTFRFTK